MVVAPLVGTAAQVIPSNMVVAPLVGTAAQGMPANIAPTLASHVPTVSTRTDIVAGENSTLQLLLSTLSAAADPTSERRKAMKIHGFYISDTAYPNGELPRVSYKQFVNFTPDMNIQSLSHNVLQKATLFFHEIFIRAPCLSGIPPSTFFSWI